jgi:hypothetical protein
LSTGNINAGIIFVVTFLKPEKVILYYKKYEYKLKWNYFEEILQFLGLL